MDSPTLCSFYVVTHKNVEFSLIFSHFSMLPTFCEPKSSHYTESVLIFSIIMGHDWDLELPRCQGMLFLGPRSLGAKNTKNSTKKRENMHEK
jgi:hypothetical protein